MDKIPYCSSKGKTKQGKQAVIGQSNVCGIGV